MPTARTIRPTSPRCSTACRRIPVRPPPPGTGSRGGWRQTRTATTIRNWITRDRVRDTGCSLKAARRDVLNALPQFDGMHRFLPTLIRFQGGLVVEVPVSHRARRSGRSKYTARNRAVAALRDAFGVRWLRRRALADVAREELDWRGAPSPAPPRDLA